MKLLIFLILSAIGLQAQVAPEVNPAIGPPVTPIVQYLFRDGSNNFTYICSALAKQPTYSWLRSTTTLTSIVVSSNTATVTTSTAHGLSVDNRVYVFGATVDTDFNTSAGYKIATVGSSTTFTFTTVNVADGTYTEATLGIWTVFPRSNDTVWSISRNYYTTTYLDSSRWAEGDTSFTKACDSRTTYAY